MSTIYSEIPRDFNEIEFCFLNGYGDIFDALLFSERVLFYDTCSFRNHSNLELDNKKKLIDFYKSHNTIIVITRTIIMELSSKSGTMMSNYKDYFINLKCAGIKIILLDEEMIFEVLSECFLSKKYINELLVWAVRYTKSPVSTITKTIKDNKTLDNTIIKGNDIENSNIYRFFFEKVRDNKESGDNLGEEVIGICAYLISFLPSINDGKICILTDDKGAVCKLSNIFHKSNKRILLYSTPKMIQHMFEEDILKQEEDIVGILSCLISNTDDNLVVMGTTAYDIDVNKHISMNCLELARKIMLRKISVIF